MCCSMTDNYDMCTTIASDYKRIVSISTLITSAAITVDKCTFQF